jgi:hypothetical protein
VPVPNEDKILKRMAENAAKGAALVERGTPLWDQAIAGLKTSGVEYAQPGVNEGLLGALHRGELSLWKLSDGTFHITERGFSPGNQSLS